MTEKFPWFAARLLFEACVSGTEPSEALYEQRIVLIHSDSGIEAAGRKAEKLGKAAGDEYKNAAGEQVSWRFKEVLDLVQLNEASIHEGTEVYHQYLNFDEVEQVRQSLRSIA